MEDPRGMAFVAMGSNLGDSRGILDRAFGRLEDLSRFGLLRSSLWRSAPVACPPGSPDFLNAVAGLVPLRGETPESLLGKLKVLEEDFGRRPKVLMNEPRPLDLDLIVFRTEVRASSELTLPHPRAHVRRFVLEPLSELAPGLVLPGQRLSVREVLARLGGSDRVERVEWAPNPDSAIQT